MIGGITAHRALPEGEKIGAIFWHDGEKYYVTQAEIDRVKSMPSTSEVRRMVESVEALMAGDSRG